jgi:hypothetical protein
VSVEPPVPVTGKLLELNITGYLFPAHANRSPVFLRIDGAGDDLFLPVFSTEEKLCAVMGKISYDRILQICDGREFLDSIEEDPRKLRVIVDPHKHESGTTRFQEVIGAS